MLFINVVKEFNLFIRDIFGNIKMNYDRIYLCDFVNGLGCRVVFFVIGCLYKCEGCYNCSIWNVCNG